MLSALFAAVLLQASPAPGACQVQFAAMYGIIVPPNPDPEGIAVVASAVENHRAEVRQLVEAYDRALAQQDEMHAESLRRHTEGLLSLEDYLTVVTLTQAREDDIGALIALALKPTPDCNFGEGLETHRSVLTAQAFLRRGERAAAP